MTVRKSETKTLSCGHGDLVVGDLEDFLKGLPEDARVRIDVDKGYGQLDPGGITITVTNDA